MAKIRQRYAPKPAYGSELRKLWVAGKLDLPKIRQRKELPGKRVVYRCDQLQKKLAGISEFATLRAGSADDTL